MTEDSRGRAVNPACPNAANPFHRCAEYCPVAAPAGKSPAQNGTGAHGDGAGGARQQAVNPGCPNADNPFHRCADYCPVAPPAAKSPPLPPGLGGQNGRTHSDGDLQPRTRRRDRAGGSGSGGLPLYVFLREGASDGEGKKVDPRCPNAANPFHVCTNHCLAKMVEGGRSSEGVKSPISLFSRHSGRSTSSSEDGSVKSGGSKKAGPKCPNAGNPFHECGEHCTIKMKELEKQKKADKKLPRKKGRINMENAINQPVDRSLASAAFPACHAFHMGHINRSPLLQPSKFLQFFATTVLLQEYIEETGDVGSCCNGGFATRVLLQKNREERVFTTKVLLQENRKENVLQHGSCCRKLEKRRFCNRDLVTEN